MFLPYVTVGLFALFFVLYLLVTAFFIWIGSKLAGIKNATIGKAVISALAGGILASISMGIVGSIPFIGFVAPLIALILYLWVLKVVFDTTWGKVFIAWLFSIVAFFIVMIFLGAIGMLIWSAFMPYPWHMNGFIPGRSPL
jgi:hypothetical protein